MIHLKTEFDKCSQKILCCCAPMHRKHFFAQAKDGSCFTVTQFTIFIFNSSDPDLRKQSLDNIHFWATSTRSYESSIYYFTTRGGGGPRSGDVWWRVGCPRQWWRHHLGICKWMFSACSVLFPAQNYACKNAKLRIRKMSLFCHFFFKILSFPLRLLLFLCGANGNHMLYHTSLQEL